jgi:hypothetical protein
LISIKKLLPAEIAAAVQSSAWKRSSRNSIGMHDFGVETARNKAAQVAAF